MTVSSSGTALARPCPTVVVSRSGPRGTQSAEHHECLPERYDDAHLRTFDRKSMPIVAWYVGSKESYMNRVMSDVFPTVLIISLCAHSCRDAACLD